VSDDKLQAALAHGRPFDRTLQVLPVADPAAGALPTFTVPGGMVVHVRSVSFKVVTSAAVANRVFGFTVDDQSSVLSGSVANVVQTAGLTRQYVFADDFGATPTNVAGTLVVTSNPSLVLPAGYRLTLVASALDAADQVSNFRVWAEVIASTPLGEQQLYAAGALAEAVETSPFLSGELS